MHSNKCPSLNFIFPILLLSLNQYVPARDTASLDLFGKLSADYWYEFDPQKGHKGLGRINFPPLGANEFKFTASGFAPVEFENVTIDQTYLDFLRGDISITAGQLVKRIGVPHFYSPFTFKWLFDDHAFLWIISGPGGMVYKRNRTFGYGSGLSIQNGLISVFAKIDKFNKGNKSGILVGIKRTEGPRKRTELSTGTETSAKLGKVQLHTIFNFNALFNSSIEYNAVVHGFIETTYPLMSNLDIALIGFCYQEIQNRESLIVFEGFDIEWKMVPAMALASGAAYLYRPVETATEPEFFVALRPCFFDIDAELNLRSKSISSFPISLRISGNMSAHF